MNDTIILNPEAFAPIFSKAWYVVINGFLYEKVDDYEREDGSLCTIFSAVHFHNLIEIDYETIEKECEVKFDTKTGEYQFIGEAAKEIPAFQILGLIKVVTCCGIPKIVA